MLEVGQDDAALGAFQHGAALQLLPDGLHRLGLAAVPPAQAQPAVVVGAILGEVDLLRLDLVRDAQRHLEKSQVVHADIQQRATAQLRTELPLPPGALGHKSVLAGPLPHFPNDAAGQHPPQLGIQRQKADPQRLHQKQPLFGGHGVELPGLVRRQGERLLTQHVLAVFQAQPHILRVQAVGSCDVDRFHLRVRSQRLIRAVGVGNAVRRPKGRRTFGPPRSRRRQDLPFPLHLFQGGCKFLGDVSCSQNAPFHGDRPPWYACRRFVFSFSDTTRKPPRMQAPGGPPGLPPMQNVRFCDYMQVSIDKPVKKYTI